MPSAELAYLGDGEIAHGAQPGRQLIHG